MKKLSLQDLKSFLKSKKNLLIIFLILLIILLSFWIYLLNKVIKSKDEVFDALLNSQRLLEESREILNDDSEEKKIEAGEDFKEEGYSKTYDVEEFSDEYNVQIEVFNYEQDYKHNFVRGDSGVFHILNKTSDEEIISLNSNFIWFDVKDKKVQVNKEDLYDNGPIFYQDFNLDSVKDFAIMEGNNSCYGGPSFDVYLIKNGEFVLSKEFSDLAQDYCGMFTVKNNKILTMTKSGCCQHEYNEFSIINGKPKLISKITESVFAKKEGDVLEITTEELVNGAWTKEVITEPYEK